jgi:hypothetical protein
MARIITISSVLIALLVSAIVPANPSYAQTTLRLITQFNLNNTSKVKYPSIDVSGNTVHVTTNNDEDSALYFTKGETATSFASPFRLGNADGFVDFTAVAVDAGPDGSVYAAWINADSRVMYLRRRDPAGNWGPLRTVDNTNSPGGRDFTAVGVTSTGTVFVFWRDIDRPVRYRFSTDQGASWSNLRNLSDTVAYREPIDVATGPNGQIAVSFSASVEPLSVFVSVWNGSSFDTRVGAENAAGSSITYAPNGKLYISWRGASDQSSNNGMFYAEQQSNGTFPRSRLAGGSVSSGTAISADAEGNLHFGWAAPVGGDVQLYYAFRSASGQFAGPIGSDSGGIFNVDGAPNISDSTYFHTVSEVFTGNTSRVRYSLFSSGAPGINATPLIEEGAALTRRNDNLVSVAFQVTGPTPNQVRYRWGAPPTDTQFDSTGAQGWETYSTPKLVTVPERIRNVCGEQVLYTQVRVAGGTTETVAKSDGITIDSVVNTPGVLAGLNPYSAEAANDPITPTEAIELTAGSASNTGSPKYTRIDAINIEIDNATDCSGLDTVAIGKNANSLTTPDLIVNNRFDKRIFFPTGALTPGRNDYIIRLKDKAGNTLDIPDTIFYDDTDPVLVTATLTLTPTQHATLLVDLQFSNVNVTDTIYDENGRKFWGVWVAVSRTAVDPNTASNLVWVPLKASGTGNSFTISNFSLASGLASSSVTPGTYYVYARFLDGAGNSTDGFVSASRTLAVVEGPQVILPLVRK